MRSSLIFGALASSLLTLTSASNDHDHYGGYNNFEHKCSEIAHQLHLPNATVWFSEYVPAGKNITFPDDDVSCAQGPQAVSEDICRVALYVATSHRSGISMEAWLPKTWNNRFLSTGNGGLGGCIQYIDMAYTAGQGFATVGANNVSVPLNASEMQLTPSRVITAHLARLSTTTPTSSPTLPGDRE